MEMKTDYRRDLQQTWMILSGGGVPDKEAYPVRMLTENRIGGLLPCRTVSLDGELRFYYDISSRHALRTILESEPVTHDLLEQILSSLARVMERLSEYLLDPDGLLLDPAYLFWNPERSEIRFCWYPGKKMQFREQAKILGGALLAQLDQADRAGVVLGYQFYQNCESGELTPASIRGLLRVKPPEKEERPATKEEIERAAILDSFFDEPEEEDSGIRMFGHRIRSWFSGKRKKKENADQPQEAEKEYDLPEESGTGKAPVLGETGGIYKENVCGGRKDTENIYGKKADGKSAGSETMLLTPDMLMTRQKKTWCLRIIEERGKEREFPLTETMYFVGKAEAGAALQLASPAVSRLHARLEKTGDNWALTDVNSKNGTRRTRVCAGGKQTEVLLQPEETVMLQEGDVIWFADVMCLVIKQ